MGPSQGDVVGFARVRFDPAQVFKHHKPARGDHPLGLVGIKHLQHVVAAQRPLQVFVGQEQPVVGEVDFGPKTCLVVFHGGAVEPGDVFAWMQV